MKNRSVIYTAPLLIPFEPDLAGRYDNVLACVHACVCENSMTLASIAKGMGMSSSDLSRKLANNPNDTRRLTTLDLENFIRTTGDTAPILYLVHKYCTDPEIKKREALNALADLIPHIHALIRDAMPSSV